MCLVEDAYRRWRDKLVSYANARTQDRAEAEDIVQEAFVRLLSLGDMVCQATVKSLAFTSVQNLLVDRLRHRVRRERVHADIYKCSVCSTEAVEERVHVNSLLKLERERVRRLPDACRKIYFMNRYQDMTVDEISEELHLARRTVETQLFRGRKKVRAYLKVVGGC